MNRLKEKLNSRRGASVLIALGLLLICTMISSVIIVAAASGSSRNVQRRKAQESYLAVSSAAQVIIDELSNIKKYVGREEQLNYACNDYELRTLDFQVQKPNGGTDNVTKEGYLIPGESDPTKQKLISDTLCIDSQKDRYTYLKEDPEDSSIALATDLNGALENFVLKGIEDIYFGRQDWDSNPILYTYTDSFDLSLETTDERLPVVHCDCYMDNHYNIKIEVTVPDSSYAVTITVDGKSVTETNIVDVGETEDSLVCSHAIWYNQEDETDGLILAEGTAEIVGTRTIDSITIEWENIKLIKGIQEVTAP